MQHEPSVVSNFAGFPFQVETVDLANMPTGSKDSALGILSMCVAHGCVNGHDLLSIDYAPWLS